MALSLRRANAVKDALVRNGVPAGAISGDRQGREPAAGPDRRRRARAAEPSRRDRDRRRSTAAPAIFADPRSYCKALSDKWREYRNSQVDTAEAAAIAKCEAGNYAAGIPTLEDAHDRREDPAAGAWLSLARPPLHPGLSRILTSTKKAALRAAFFVVSATKSCGQSASGPRPRVVSALCRRIGRFRLLRPEPLRRDGSLVRWWRRRRGTLGPLLRLLAIPLGLPLRTFLLALGLALCSVLFGRLELRLLPALGRHDGTERLAAIVVDRSHARVIGASVGRRRQAVGRRLAIDARAQRRRLQRRRLAAEPAVEPAAAVQRGWWREAHRGNVPWGTKRRSPRQDFRDK